MKLAVIGSRGINDAEFIVSKLDQLCFEYQVTTIVSGGAKGVDSIAEGWAKDNGIETLIFKPDYQTYAPSIAPLMRNETIVAECDYLIAFWDGRSRGSEFTIKAAKSAGKLLKVFYQTRNGWMRT